MELNKEEQTMFDQFNEDITPDDVEANMPVLEEGPNLFNTYAEQIGARYNAGEITEEEALQDISYAKDFYGAPEQPQASLEAGREKDRVAEAAKQPLPTSIMKNFDETTIKTIQKGLGVTEDGKWGPGSQNAYEDTFYKFKATDSIVEDYRDYNEGDDWKKIGKGMYNPITGIKANLDERNHNPANMKFEFAGAILGKTVSPKKMRSRAKAIQDAKKKYKGVVTLDRAGFIIFESPEAGRAAARQMMPTVFGKYTIKEMVPKYAISDGSGTAAKKTYIDYILKRFKEDYKKDYSKSKIKTLTKDENKSLTNYMAEFESGNTK